MKALWLSRHEMTKEQLEDLSHFLAPYWWVDGQDLESVEHRNVTFPARSPEAVEAITKMVSELVGDDEAPLIVCGVFPAHIAGALTRLLNDGYVQALFLVPVSVPAPAKEGETRGGGFVHSHWEQL